MDTKSKSKHSLGVAIIWIIVLAAAMGTVGLYPYIVGRAKEYKTIYQERRKQDNANNMAYNLATQVMNSSYQAWREQMQEEEGHLLTPSQVFLPELEGKLNEAKQEEYGTSVQQDTDGEPGEVSIDDSSLRYDTYFYESLKETMDSVGSDWQGFSQAYANRLKYQMLDESGKRLRSNVSDPDWEFSNLTGDEILFTVHFTSSGALKVGQMEEVANRDQLQQALGQYEFYDPMAVRLGSDYRYGGVEFSGPKNVTFQFKCSPSALAGDNYDSVSENLGYYDFMREGTMYTVIFAMCGMILVMALALPAIKSLEIGRSALCRVNFEPVCMLGGLWLFMLLVAGLPGMLIAATHNERLQLELLRANFSAPAAQILAMILNLLFWVVVYGMFYWGITCLRAVFSLGLWRYIKERTWLGRFCCFVKRWVCRCLNPFNETDWHSNSSKAIGKAVFANFIILSLVSCLWFFGIGALVIYSFALFFLINRYWKEMEEKYNRLLDAINLMAEGQLDVEVTEDLGLFNPIKEQLARVRLGFKKAVDQEVKSERTKTELITNVSHDLKTPLTAIITYVNLLKQPDITEEERNSYIQVLDQKSMRLKVLIEDLFEVSKASSGAVTMNRGPVDIVSLIKQVRLELSDRIESCGVEFRWNLPEEKILLYLDSQRTYRIFENLLVNITKYAMPGTRAYVNLDMDAAGTVTIVLRNISARELTVLPEDLTERFVRGDTARNTEGSGLGLAIARSFTELQDGTMDVSVEGDLFRVVIRWKVMREKPEGGNDGDGTSQGGGEQNGGRNFQGGSAQNGRRRDYREDEGEFAPGTTPSSASGSVPASPSPRAQSPLSRVRDVLRHGTGESAERVGRKVSGLSRRWSERELARAKEEEARRELARAVKSEMKPQPIPIGEPEPEPETESEPVWDIAKDDSWSAVLTEKPDNETNKS